MTGFGRATAQEGGHSCTVEIRTVNHRFCEISMRVPRQLQEHEAALRHQIADRLARGSISVSVVVDDQDDDVGLPVINREVSRRYLRELRGLQKEHGLAGAIEIGILAQLPELFTWERGGVSGKRLLPLVRRTLDEALELVSRDRRREGQALERECKKRVNRMSSLLKQAEKRAPVRTREMKDRYQERVQGLARESGIDNHRLSQELAILADRLDFTEECVRMSAHTEQFKELAKSDEPLGRRLSFLLQEMGREANTIGSKANDPGISMLVVEMKEEIEKLREQIQNIE